MPARELAVALLGAVLLDQRALDDALADPRAQTQLAGLPARDRGLARLIAATALRRHGEIGAVIAQFLERPLPRSRGRLTAILHAAAAQLLFLGTPAHAAINVAVEQCRRDRGARRFGKLANAVLRRVAREGPAELASQGGARLDIPTWLWSRWQATYGLETTQRIAESSLAEAELDITAPREPEAWAVRLGGTLLATGSIRLAPASGRIEELPGYGDGAWWVQDTAASLPARLLGDVRGLRVADLCAAPGGKTAQLAAAGARVTAVERSPDRLARLAQNLARLRLEATLVEADAADWSPAERFDAVLVDAPCTATGTIRRHPDILHLKRPGDLNRLAATQTGILRNGARLVHAGGLLVYCACSLEPEEGEHQIARLLTEMPEFARRPVQAMELGIEAAAVTAAGDLRTLPFHSAAGRPAHPGMDGFYAARLRRGGV
jgi:16S rRNA (cytosine967-C5)-methyltransferase